MFNDEDDNFVKIYEVGKKIKIHKKYFKKYWLKMNKRYFVPISTDNKYISIYNINQIEYYRDKQNGINIDHYNSIQYHNDYRYHIYRGLKINNDKCLLYYTNTNYDFLKDSYSKSLYTNLCHSNWENRSPGELYGSTLVNNYEKYIGDSKIIDFLNNIQSKKKIKNSYFETQEDHDPFYFLILLVLYK